MTVLLVGWLMAGGCGVKGPPIPLRQQAPLPAVSDLAYRLADHSVMLTWTLSSGLDGKAARQAAFVVLRSRMALDAPACDNCPLAFETVGRLPYVEADDAPFILNIALEAGNRYVFSVHMETDGMKGPDSNLVTFDHPSDSGGVPVEEP